MTISQINEASKVVKKTIKVMNDNDIHFHSNGKGDHAKFKCAHSGRTFIQDMGNKNEKNHQAKVNDVKKHRAAIGKPFISKNA